MLFDYPEKTSSSIPRNQYLHSIMETAILLPKLYVQCPLTAVHHLGNHTLIAVLKDGEMKTQQFVLARVWLLWEQ